MIPKVEKEITTLKERIKSERHAFDNKTKKMAEQIEDLKSEVKGIFYNIFNPNLQYLEGWCIGPIVWIFGFKYSNPNYSILNILGKRVTSNVK